MSIRSNGTENQELVKIKILPRMYTVSPKECERYPPRILEIHVKGVVDYESLHRVDDLSNFYRNHRKMKFDQ